MRVKYFLFSFANAVSFVFENAVSFVFANAVYFVFAANVGYCAIAFRKFRRFSSVA